MKTYPLKQRKLLWTLLLTFHFLSAVNGQNLVNNPSFEDTIACPPEDGNGRIYYCKGWRGYSGTVDYYNVCAGNIPNNSFCECTIKPVSGMACTALVCSLPQGNPDSLYREVMGSKLKSPLQIGQKYYFSMYAKWTPGFMASSGLGVNFSTREYYWLNDPVPINNIAKVYSKKLLLDSINWTQIKGSFIADSAYQYIMIGNFFDTAHTLTLGTRSYAYYFIDNITLSTDSMTAIEKVPSPNSLEVTVFPNPAINEVNVNVETQEEVSFSIYDLTGRMISSQKVANSDYIDIRKLQPGIYFYQVNNRHGQVFRAKFLKI